MVNDNCVVVVSALFSLIVGEVASVRISLLPLPVVVSCAHEMVMEARKRIANAVSRSNDHPHLSCLLSANLARQTTPVSRFSVFFYNYIGLL